MHMMDMKNNVKVAHLLAKSRRVQVWQLVDTR